MGIINEFEEFSNIVKTAFCSHVWNQLYESGEYIDNDGWEVHICMCVCEKCGKMDHLRFHKYKGRNDNK